MIKTDFQNDKGSYSEGIKGIHCSNENSVLENIFKEKVVQTHFDSDDTELSLFENGKSVEKKYSNQEQFVNCLSRIQEFAKKLPLEEFPETPHFVTSVNSQDYIAKILSEN
jgi:hypothetical protein